MAAVVALLLGGSTAFYTIRLAQERDRARREAVKANKVSELMVGLLTGADPIANRATGEAPTVRGLLDAGAEQAQRGLVDQSDVKADILTVLGRVYRRLGVFDRAQVLLEQALVVGRTAYGAEDVRLAQTLNDLGVLLTDKGDYAGAARYLEQSLAMRRKLLGPEHADVAVTLVELGRVYQDQGFNQRADPLLRESLAIRRKTLGEDHRETAVSLNAVAAVLRLNGDLAGAEALTRQSLELNRKTRGEYHANTGVTMHDLGVIAASKGDFASAESLFRQALVVHRRALGNNHPNVATRCRACSSSNAAIRRRPPPSKARWTSHGPRSDAIISWSRSTRSISRRCSWRGRIRQPPKRSPAKGYGSARLRPISSRAAGAHSSRTTGASAERKAFSAPRGSRAASCRKPRTFCSMPCTISTRCRRRRAATSTTRSSG